MDKGLQLLEQIIKTSAFRHKVLSSNIANADTPGYRAKDVPFGEEMTNQIIELDKTNPSHIQGGKTLKETMGMVPVERSSWEDGNNVVLDMELANMTENALLYEAGIKLLSKKLMIYKNAIKGR
ncbi:MAG: flagellar basal-body rod protein FlgB [Deltaproteobacteria bacterium RBG_13_43_22]|nr:MAG: flagellar basal-body rod protein FlgB [Deltaproteobacteria bacterium RBG_13_43_22]